MFATGVNIFGGFVFMDFLMPKRMPPGTAEMTSYINEDVKLRFKLACVSEKKSMSKVLEQIIIDWLESREVSKNDTTSSK